MTNEQQTGLSLDPKATYYPFLNLFWHQLILSILAIYQVYLYLYNIA